MSFTFRIQRMRNRNCICEPTQSTNRNSGHKSNAELDVSGRCTEWRPKSWMTWKGVTKRAWMSSLLFEPRFVIQISVCVCMRVLASWCAHVTSEAGEVNPGGVVVQLNCLEDERPRWEDELNKYREIINRQKAEIGRQREKLEEITALQEQHERYQHTHTHILTYTHFSPPGFQQSRTLYFIFPCPPT